MPASNSMAIPRGRRSQVGDSSVRKRAMPKLIGKAMTRAMIEVTIVPYMGITAPKRSAGGFHSELVRKLNPNSLIDGKALQVSDRTIPTSSASVMAAKDRVRLRKMASPSRARLWDSFMSVIRKINAGDDTPNTKTPPPTGGGRLLKHYRAYLTALPAVSLMLPQDLPISLTR